MTTPVLQVDLVTSKITLATKSCTLDPIRLAEIQSLLASAEVCVPVLPPDTVSCMAISLADIKLEGIQDPILLRKTMCNYGVHLCAGQDAKFREIIQSLIDSPPATCQ